MTQVTTDQKGRDTRAATGPFHAIAVKVVVVLHPGEQLDPAALIQWLPHAAVHSSPLRRVRRRHPKAAARLRAEKMKLRVDPINLNTWDREEAVVLPRE